MSAYSPSDFGIEMSVVVSVWTREEAVVKAVGGVTSAASLDCHFACGCSLAYVSSVAGVAYVDSTWCGSCRDRNSAAEIGIVCDLYYPVRSTGPGVIVAHFHSVH